MAYSVLLSRKMQFSKQFYSSHNVPILIFNLLRLPGRNTHCDKAFYTYSILYCALRYCGIIIKKEFSIYSVRSRGQKLVTKKAEELNYASLDLSKLNEIVPILIRVPFSSSMFYMESFILKLQTIYLPQVKGQRNTVKIFQT